ncbi:hypothetical protein RND71_023284 [Anisodus tanguticus]|uniref:Uncharacterized protein n=1 Tax=Anisodus tanguticus TaxID=243964 RepID=A0AAE1RSB8_9SOLA|nr:hypothetical protein RND71_023284 [Anisodus tanguticus]
MAYSTNSKTLHYSSWKFMYLIILLSLVLDFGGTEGSRATTTMKNSKQEASKIFSEPSTNYGGKKEFIKSNWLSMLPKGDPIPPSAPSKRHNYYTDPYP